MARQANGWDEPEGASSPRGWLHQGGMAVGFYLDYQTDTDRPAHTTEIYRGHVVSFCSPDKLCKDCQPGSILARRYPGGPGTEATARYVETIAQAREFVETGQVT